MAQKKCECVWGEDDRIIQLCLDHDNYLKRRNLVVFNLSMTAYDYVDDEGFEVPIDKLMSMSASESAKQIELVFAKMIARYKGA